MKREKRKQRKDRKENNPEESQNEGKKTDTESVSAQGQSLNRRMGKSLRQATERELIC